MKTKTLVNTGLVDDMRGRRSMGKKIGDTTFNEMADLLKKVLSNHHLRELRDMAIRHPRNLALALTARCDTLETKAEWRERRLDAIDELEKGAKR